EPGPLWRHEVPGPRLRARSCSCGPRTGMAAAYDMGAAWDRCTCLAVVPAQLAGCWQPDLPGEPERFWRDARQGRVRARGDAQYDFPHRGSPAVSHRGGARLWSDAVPGLAPDRHHWWRVDVSPEPLVAAPI